MIRLSLWLTGASLAAALAFGTHEAKSPSNQAEALTPRQWRVIWTEEPAYQATISWTTTVAGKTHEVLVSPTPLEGRLEQYPTRVETHRNGAFTRDGSDPEDLLDGYYHHARLEGLDPSSTYWFVIVSDGVASREFHFVTAPEDEREFRLLYGGDSRTGRKARQQVNAMMVDLLVEDPSILAMAHGGDYIVNGRLWAQWSAWLDDHSALVTPAGRVLPIIPARGNHDVGPLFQEIFDDPGGTDKNYYATQLGSSAALLTLNSEISTTGDQALWLEEQLGELRSLNRWLLCNYHRPLYPAVKQPAIAKSTWVPLFEHFDVDLVLESDGHVFKRTLPIRDEKHDPTGVTYIGEGGLGVPQRTPDESRWYLQAPGATGRGHHVQLLTFNAEELRMQTIGLPLDASEFQPADYAEVHPLNAEWSYLAGTDPSDDWKAPGFDASAWPTGPAGFGYGDDDDQTVLDDMRGEYTRVYVRHRIPAAALEGVEELALMIRFDDGFIAYAGGEEFVRERIEGGAGSGAIDVSSHEARSRYSYLPIPDWRSKLVGDELVIAIEGHNDRASSSDFTLDPFLIADPANLGLLGKDQSRVLMDDHKLSPREP